MKDVNPPRFCKSDTSTLTVRASQKKPTEVCRPDPPERGLEPAGDYDQQYVLT